MGLIFRRFYMVIFIKYNLKVYSTTYFLSFSLEKMIILLRLLLLS